MSESFNLYAVTHKTERLTNLSLLTNKTAIIKEHTKVSKNQMTIKKFPTYSEYLFKNPFIVVGSGIERGKRRKGWVCAQYLH